MTPDELRELCQRHIAREGVDIVSDPEGVTVAQLRPQKEAGEITNQIGKMPELLPIYVISYPGTTSDADWERLWMGYELNYLSRRSRVHSLSNGAWFIRLTEAEAGLIEQDEGWVIRRFYPDMGDPHGVIRAQL